MQQQQAVKFSCTEMVMGHFRYLVVFTVNSSFQFSVVNCNVTFLSMSLLITV